MQCLCFPRYKLLFSFGHALKEETPADRLNKAYTFCLMSGSCFDPDPGMRGNEHQNNNWLSACKAAVKAGYPNPVARARSDTHYLVTQLNNGSTAPWFVRVCQSIWSNKTDSERDQIINTYCSFCCEQIEQGKQWGVASIVIDVQSMTYHKNFLYDPESNRQFKDLNVLFGSHAPAPKAQQLPQPKRKREETLPAKGKGRGKGIGKGKGSWLPLIYDPEHLYAPPGGPR